MWRRLGLRASSTRWWLWRWMLAFGRLSWLWVCPASIHDLLWHGTWSSLAACQCPETYCHGTAGTHLSCLLYGTWSRMSGAWGSIISPHMCKVSDRQLVWSPCAGSSLNASGRSSQRAPGEVVTLQMGPHQTLVNQWQCEVVNVYKWALSNC